MKKKLFLYLMLIFCLLLNTVYSASLFDNIFDNTKKIDLKINTSEKIENTIKKAVPEEDTEVDLRETKEFKSSSERNENENTDPDIFREKYQTNYEEATSQSLPDWVKERKGDKEKLYIVCKMKNDDFKMINVLDENWYISPEYSPENNYYSYFWSRVKFVYVWNWAYEQVKECDFSPLEN